MSDQIPGPQFLDPDASAREVLEEAGIETSELNFTVPDPDRYLAMAKRLVIENYNSHHDPAETAPLTMEDVYIISFTKMMKHWKAVVISGAAKRMVWLVTYNGTRREAYIEVCRKINNVTVQMRRISP